MLRVLVHAPGPPGHGAVRHARTVGRLVGRCGAEVVSAGGAEVVSAGAPDVVHAHFTDALWGRNVDEAATAYERWAATAPRPIVVTLHDVPGADPDRRRDARRCAGYIRVVRASDGTIVSSRHEATKVAQLGVAPARFIELPLPQLDATPSAAPEPAWAGGVTLGLLGFLYPGKGHAEVIDAAARRSPRPAVVSLGAISPGHEALWRQLTAQAAGRGVEMVVTGDLAPAALALAARLVTVPLAANRSVSASASTLAWVAAGRRPVAATGPYNSELATRHPGLVGLYDTDAELDSAIDAAVGDPGHTRREGPPAWPDVGGLHVGAYREVWHNARSAGGAGGR